MDKKSGYHFAPLLLRNVVGNNTNKGGKVSSPEPLTHFVMVIRWLAEKPSLHLQIGDAVKGVYYP